MKPLPCAPISLPVDSQAPHTAEPSIPTARRFPSTFLVLVGVPLPAVEPWLSGLSKPPGKEVQEALLHSANPLEARLTWTPCI